MSWSRQGHLVYACKSIKKAANLCITYLECTDGRVWQLAPPTSFRVPGFGDTRESTRDAPELNTLVFSNTGWDIFTADSSGNVSILVTGIQRTQQNKTTQTPSLLFGQAQSPASVQAPNPPSATPTPAQAIQYSRTSFNTAELFYSDSTQLPLPSLKTPRDHMLNQIVAIKWLNVDKALIANGPAKRMKQTPDTPASNGCAAPLGAAAPDSDGYYYSYSAHQHKPQGPMHPLSTKQACFGVRRSGEICLWHQEDHGIEYKRVVGSLDLEAGREILTASISFTKEGHIIITAHTDCSANPLLIYEVKINWGFLIEAAKQLPKIPTFRVPDSERTPPALSIVRVLKFNLGDLCCNNERLVSIDTISPNYKEDSELEVLLTMETVARFTNDPVKTILYRYQLREIPVLETLHGSFKDIGSSKMDVDGQTGYKLHYIQNLEFNESILSIEPVNLGTILCITFCNGMVKMIDESFQVMTNPYEKAPLDEETIQPPEEIHTLVDAGFEFPQMDFQPRCCCISPNACMYVAMGHDNSRLYIRTIESHIDPALRRRKPSGLLLVTSAGFALAHTSACYLGYFTDDLIATVRTELEYTSQTVSESYSFRLLVSILQEAQHAINLNIDISTEQTDKMSQNQPLQRIITLQLALGTNQNWRRTRSGKIALSLLNLRFVSSSIMYAIHTIYSNMQRFSRKGMNVSDTYANSRVREDSIIYIIGVIRWSLDYIVLLSKEMLELRNAFQAGNKQDTEKLINKLFVVPLIMGKVPRAFLLFSIANIRRLFSFVQKFVEKNYSSLTTLVSPENPMGAFRSIEKSLLEDSASVFDTPPDSLVPVANDKASRARAIMAHPTVEAYYRIGALIENCPVPLAAFEKFLLDSDGPLRKLSSPTTSLAIEQQLVCQGYVSKTFIPTIDKLCEAFDKNVLSLREVNVPELYFYDTQWLRLDGYEEESEIGQYFGLTEETEQVGQLASEAVQAKSETTQQEMQSGKVLLPRTDFDLAQKSARRLVYINCMDGLILDTLRKQLLKPTEFIQYDKLGIDGDSPSDHFSLARRSAITVPDTGDFKRIAMRFCIRCGSISSVHDEALFVPGHPSLIENPVFQHYQRLCFCGGSWANL